MNKDYNYQYITITMFIMILIMCFLNFNASKELISQRDNNIESASYTPNEKVQKDSLKYSDIIKGMEGRKYIKIEKVANNIDENIINVKTKFKGELYLLSDFINEIKNEENFYNINSISLEQEKDKIYTGELYMDFIYDVD